MTTVTIILAEFLLLSAILPGVLHYGGKAPECIKLWVGLGQEGMQQECGNRVHASHPGPIKDPTEWNPPDGLHYYIGEPRRV